LSAMSERVHRSVMNVKVGMLFYLLSLPLAFFSRKIFLDCLGAEFIGLTNMLMNIMSYLSVAELGIGLSISYFLYKPLQEDNHEKINEVMSMLAYLYRCIGFIIGGIGLIISLFFPWWFDNLGTGLFLVYFAFYSFLASSMTGYIFNYKNILVGANQKQYLVSAFFQSIAIVQSLVQIILAYYYRNLYLWVVVGLVFTIIGVIIFNYRIRQLYPWLQINLAEGRKNLKKYPDVLKKTRQIFARKIKDLILYRSDDIFVGSFVSVTAVAFYSNYTMITYKLIYLLNILSDGFSAGIGNLLAEGNEKNIIKVFWELTAFRFLIIGIVIFSLIMFFQPFITCWLGAEYRLDDSIVYLLILHIFIFQQSILVYKFIESSGLFGDVWMSWLELVVNLAVTIMLAPYYGIAGILLGKIISLFGVNFFWKPYYLFSQGFHKSVWVFWKGMFAFYSSIILFSVCSWMLRIIIIEKYADSLLTLVIYGTITAIPLFAAYFLFLFQFTKGMKYFVARKPAVYQILCKITI
jgi:O-antigen/teichoic acid export membrane protein